MTKKKQDIGNMPPQALDLEQAVLGAIMLEKNAFESVIDLLNEDVFYTESHKAIFRAIRNLFSNSQAIDIRTVVHQLRKAGELDIAGGTAYIASLTREVASSAHIISHTHILLEKAIKRNIISISNKGVTEGYDDEVDAFELKDSMEKSLSDIMIGIKKDVQRIDNVCDSYLDEIFARQSENEGLTGIPSGFNQLDKITAGWQKQSLIILAARPAMGKTAAALSFIRNPAIDFSKPTAIFSLEMGNNQLMSRLISSELCIYGSRLNSGVFNENEQADMRNRLQKLRDTKIFIDDTPALSIFELRAKARRLKAKHSIELIVVDYLQLMSGGQGTKNFAGNREQEIAHISRSLKVMAKELDIPVIALSQLSRAVETRGGDKKPQLSDLRESGAIEQDADMVIFLHRPEYYGISEFEDGTPTEGIATFIISKNRSGALGEVQVRFKGEYTRFEDIRINESPTMPKQSSGTFENSYSNLKPISQVNQDLEEELQKSKKSFFAVNSTNYFDNETNNFN